ncbi:hypothetical protein [Brevundimonas sp.]|uniref:hypothetical protein n=1 Tax=Brevundimonas sp. TaxID=1871086 RepID=UPI004033F62F
MTPEDKALYADISSLASRLWTASAAVEGWNTDPKMFSVMLFRRLWGNHRGYTVLFEAGLAVESDIMLRSGVETSICIAANHHLRDGFVLLMKQDAAQTLAGQIKQHRDNNDTDLVREAEAILRSILASLPDGVKAAKLDWKDLAAKGQVPALYSIHRQLSGVSAHVTGISLLPGVDFVGDETPHDHFRMLTKQSQPMWMMAATLHGALIHAGMIEQLDLLAEAVVLAGRLNKATEAKGW